MIHCCLELHSACVYVCVCVGGGGGGGGEGGKGTSHNKV